MNEPAFSPTFVALESPYAGEGLEKLQHIPSGILRRQFCISYARACTLDAFKRGEIPLVSHLAYTQVLLDSDPAQRFQGIAAHLEVLTLCDKVVIYEDFGVSSGMQKAVEHAGELEMPIAYRKILDGGSITLETPSEWKLVDWRSHG